MIRVYLASPYHHSDPEVMEERYQAVCRKAAKLAKLGYYVYSPIAHWHPIAVSCELPRDWNYWKTMDEASIEKHDVVFILKLEGWSISRGIENEILLAQRYGKEVVFIKSEEE